jgi:hypothetical protein
MVKLGKLLAWLVKLNHDFFGNLRWHCDVSVPFFIKWNSVLLARLFGFLTGLVSGLLIVDYNLVSSYSIWSCLSLVGFVIFLASNSLDSYARAVFRSFINSLILSIVITCIILILFYGNPFGIKLLSIWESVFLFFIIYWCCLLYASKRHDEILKNDEHQLDLTKDEYESFYSNRKGDEILWKQYELFSEIIYKYLDFVIGILKFYLLATGAILAFPIINKVTGSYKYVLLLPVSLGVVFLVIHLLSIEYAENINKETSDLTDKDALALKIHPTADVLVMLVYGSALLYACIAAFCAYLYFDDIQMLLSNK